MQTERVFKASLKKALLLLAISAALAVIGVVMASEKPVAGWLCAGFFSLGIPASLLMMRPGTTYLRLTGEGFEIVAMSRATVYKWSDVDVFHVASIRGAKMVGISFSPAYAKQKAGRAVAFELARMEGAIADNYNASVEEICRTLNEWKSRCTAS
jgi:hypothetical protein